MESTWSPPGVHQESIRSLPGVHQEYQDFIRTPDGVHQDAWGSVTYSQKSALCSKQVGKLDSHHSIMGSMMETFLRLVNGSNNQNKIITFHIKYVKMRKIFIYPHLQV